MDTNQADVGRRLRSERTRLGLTQAQMASVGGVSVSSQHAYEAGINRIDNQYWENVHRKGVDILYVITGEQRREEINVAAMREIVLLVQEWATQRDRPTAPEALDQFIKVFYAQFEAKRKLELSDYALTLKHVG